MHKTVLIRGIRWSKSWADVEGESRLMNELKELCDKTDVDFKLVTEFMTYDDRIGKSHMKVPGPDGELGFGGACFPKDTKALLTYAKENDIILSVLQQAVNKNDTYR